MQAGGIAIVIAAGIGAGRGADTDRGPVLGQIPFAAAIGIGFALLIAHVGEDQIIERLGRRNVADGEIDVVDARVHQISISLQVISLSLPEGELRRGAADVQ